MLEYWRKPEASREALVADGWLRTGDIGHFEDGRLYINSRARDMILRGGENIYPAEIENVLMGHEAIADAAVIGVPHHRWGETPHAFVVLRPGASATFRNFSACGSAAA